MTESPGLSNPGSPVPDRLRLLTRQLVTAALDLLFPPRCLQCKRVGSLLCPSCMAKIPSVPPIHDANSPLIERRSTAEFAGVIQTAIHKFKYEGQPRYASVLGQRLADELARSGWPVTLIAAAPLHESRLRQRGYNQSELLAALLAQKTGIRFNADALRRTRDTRPQVGLNYRERQTNVDGAFVATPEIVTDQSIVVIDDVYTTGATLRACASALLEAGANQVWALTVASARVADLQTIPQ